MQKTTTPSRRGRRTNWQKVRKFFNDVHLWLGLSSGIIVIAVCLSGTIYTYNTELRELAAPHLHKVVIPEKGKRLSADSLVGVVEKLAGGAVSSIGIPASPSRSFEYTVRLEGDKSRFGTTYYVNPYTGALLGTSKEETSISKFMVNLFSLHRWLLLDKIETPIFGELPNRQLGSYITGTATILFTLGVMTGLIIWFPNKMRTWKRGFRIKWSGGWKRLNHDLHNTLAFYSLIFLFLMGATGPQWSFPWYREGMQKALGTYKAPVESGARTAPREEESRQADEVPTTRLSIGQYLASANEALPYPGDYRITMPAGNANTLSITKNRLGFFAPAAGDQLTLDVATARVTETVIFRDKPFNQRVAGSIKALHVGNLYGQFTKLLYFFACLVATSLPITGTMIWLNKMKKKPTRRPKR